jgi:hypothetical protein
MATGADHYVNAECLVREANDIGPGAAADHLLAAAQVHAMLALAAATIDAAYGNLSVDADEEWSPALAAGQPATNDGDPS